MSDHNEPCGCDESKRLRLDLANTIEARDRVVMQTKLIAQLLGSTKDLGMTHDYGLDAQALAKMLVKEHDELKAAVCDYFERFVVDRDCDLYRYYTMMDKPDRKLARATKALKDAMMRSHLGGTVSYEEMAQAVLDAVKEG